MDLGLKELGITFLVGAFTILGFELILHYFTRPGLLRRSSILTRSNQGSKRCCVFR